MPATLSELQLDTAVSGSSKGLNAVLGVPEGEGPWPGIVVLHEAFGIDEEMRKQVAHLASMGYLALMPDLFSEGGLRRCITATMRSLRSGSGRAYADIEAARLALLGREDCTGAVAVLGFCMGGGFALMSLDRGFDAAAVNYGIMPRDLSAAVANACPVVASYGARDVTLKGAAQTLELAFTERGITHDVKEYPQAGHVFMNEELNGPAIIRPLVRVMNFGPDPEAAADAWSRIRAFFDEHLVAPS